MRISTINASVGHSRRDQIIPFSWAPALWAVDLRLVHDRRHTDVAVEKVAAAAAAVVVEAAAAAVADVVDDDDADTRDVPRVPWTMPPVLTAQSSRRCVTSFPEVASAKAPAWSALNTSSPQSLAAPSPALSAAAAACEVNGAAVAIAVVVVVVVVVVAVVVAVVVDDDAARIRRQSLWEECPIRWSYARSVA